LIVLGKVLVHATVLELILELDRHDVVLRESVDDSIVVVQVGHFEDGGGSVVSLG